MKVGHHNMTEGVNEFTGTQLVTWGMFGAVGVLLMCCGGSLEIEVTAILSHPAGGG